MAVWLQAVLTLAPKATCQSLAAWLSQRGRIDISKSGGQLFGLWDGTIGQGFGPNEAILMSLWPDDASAGAAVELMKSMPQVIAVSGTPLHPTLHAGDARPLSGEGIWVFRDVHLATHELETYLDRSARVRESLGAASGGEVLGPFRGPNVDAKTASLLLVARQADSAAVARPGDAAPNFFEQLDDGPTPLLWSRNRSATLQTSTGGK